MHRGRQYVKNYRSVWCTEGGSMWRIIGRYGAPRAAVCEELQIGTVHWGRQYVKIIGLYGAPSAAVCEEL